MADSNITKRALALALKELMEEFSFEKINVAQICERCDMNRKSFYYHFKDKYDLVNWIFDTEFTTIAVEENAAVPYDERWDVIQLACEYLYENRGFYRKALKIKGQNSFRDHLWDFCFPLLKTRIMYLTEDAKVEDFYANFMTDACLCAIERWILDKECIPPQEMIAKMKYLVEKSANVILRVQCK